MPVTPEGQATIERARASKPKDYLGLSDAEVLAKVLERREQTEGFDRDRFLKDMGIGENSLGVVSGFGKGLVDSINPTTYDFEPTIDDDAYYARTIGNVVGTIGSFAAAPFAALKGAKMLGQGVRAAKALDIGGRAWIGGAAGLRSADRQAESYGLPEDESSRTKMAITGALTNALPWGVGGGRVGNALLGAAGGGAYMGGAAISQADLFGKDGWSGAAEALGDAATSPGSYILPAIGAGLGAKFPDKFGFSKIDEILAAQAAAQAARGGATATTSRRAPASTPGTAGGSTVTSGSAFSAPSATAPTAQVPPMPIPASVAAVLRGLSPQQLMEQFPQLAGVKSGPISGPAHRADESQLTALAQIMGLTRGASKAMDETGYPMQRRAMQLPLPEAGISEPTPITGYVSGNYRLGDDPATAQLMNARDLANRGEQVIFDEMGNPMRVPPGFEMLSGGSTSQSLISDQLMQQLGATDPKVQIYGRSAFPSGTQPGQIPEGFEEKLIARALGLDEPVQLSPGDVPEYTQMQQLRQQAREQDEARRQAEQIAKMNNIYGAGDSRMMRTEPAQGDAQMQALLEAITQNPQILALLKEAMRGRR